MSRGQTLRALVNERLAAAAEDIFVLFERTIVEYEEELCRFRKKNENNVQVPSSSPGPALNQEITETPWIKEEPEEQSIKPEEDQLQVPVPESSAVCVKPASLLQRRQTEHREETQGEDISSETHFHSETDHNEPFSWSGAQMEIELDGDDYNQVQFRDRRTELSPQNKSAPETSVHSGHMSAADGGHQNSVCDNNFSTEHGLQQRFTIHTEEKPYSCLICEKTFTERRNLEVHIRTHTGERPFSCSICEKAFTQKGHLHLHKRTHTGEKPYSCLICQRTFARKCHRDLHTRTHTGEKPYSCSNCEKQFSDPSSLRRHRRRHTGEKPFSCTVCGKSFIQKGNFRSHMSGHSITNNIEQFDFISEVLY